MRAGIPDKGAGAPSPPFERRLCLQTNGDPARGEIYLKGNFSAHADRREAVPPHPAYSPSDIASNSSVFSLPFAASAGLQNQPFVSQHCA